MLVQYSSIVVVMILMITLAAKLALGRHVVMLDKGPEDVYVRLKLSLCEMINSVGVFSDMKFFSSDDALKTYFLIDTLLTYSGKQDHEEFTASYLNNACSLKALLRRRLSMHEIKMLECKIKQQPVDEVLQPIPLSDDLLIFVMNMQRILELSDINILDNLVVILKTKVMIFEAAVAE